jgi:ribosomal-protein-alanine N-acetyltransferase
MDPLWTPPTIETDRLVLRPVTEADADAVFAACSNPNLTRFTLFETHKTRNDSLDFVRDYVASSYAQKAPDPLAITLKGDTDPRMIGAIGCRWVPAAGPILELGYWIAEHLWGRGIATEATTAVLRYVFATFPFVERVQSRVIVGNPASARVLEKAGFQYEGTLRSAAYRREREQFHDLMMFALLQSEWGG